MTKSLEEVKKEVFESIEVENIKHQLMITHLEKESSETADKEQAAKLLLKVKEIKDKIEVNNRFIRHNE